jgi:hypothetical protein
MVKQSSSVSCICGRTIQFPEGEIKTKCSCGTVWECGPEGYWYAEEPVVEFAPILAKPAKVRSRAEKYRNYPKSKRKRKAGKR